MSDETKPKRQLLLIVLSGLALFLLISLIVRFNDHGRLIDDASSVLVGPDYEITGFDLHEYDVKGQLHYQIQATEVTHYPTNDTTELKSPHFAQQNETGAPVLGSADMGYILAKGDRVLMQGNAIIQQPKVNHSQELIARSDHFTYYPNKRTADTEAEVSFTSPGSSMTGIGMNADFNSKILNILSNVKGTHATH